MTINDGELYEAVDTNCELCNGTGIYDDPELGDIDCYCVGDSSMTGDRYEGCTPHDLSDDAEALASAGMGTDEDYGSYGDYNDVDDWN
jgi:hypothetical protein